MSSSQNALSTLQWHEPIEGLEFGEHFLGAVTSVYFWRRRRSGYGFFFTDRRVIGIKLGRALRNARVWLNLAIAAAYLVLLYYLLSGATALTFLSIFLLPLVLHIASIPIDYVTRRVTENSVSRKANNPSTLLKLKRDFDLNRSQIAEFFMQSPPRGLSLGLTHGYLRIIQKDRPLDLIEVKLYGWHQSQRLRDLVIRFSSIEPKVRAMEYPPN